MQRLWLTCALVSWLGVGAACGDDDEVEGRSGDGDAAAETTPEAESDAEPDQAPTATDVERADDGPGPQDDTASDAPKPDADDSPLGGDRPARVVLPDDYRAGAAYPLLILLHGYSASGDVQDLYLGLSPRAAERGFITLVPDGTVDATGQRFWNASPGWCCDFYGANVDDAVYLLGLVAEAGERFTIDPARVYLIGHSNGAFMSYKMACDHAGVFAAIATIAGATPLDQDDCAPSESVSVLHIHGSADGTILFSGVPGRYPSAETSAARWASHNGCELLASDEEASRDYDNAVLGAETRPRPYPNCEPGRDVQLWQMQGSSHVPVFSDAFIPDVLDWFLAHPK